MPPQIALLSLILASWLRIKILPLVLQHPISHQETEPMLFKPLSYWQMATSDNTRKAYQADIRRLIQHGVVLPMSTEMLLHYLESQAETISPRSLKRHLVAIKNWHTYQGFADPTSHPLIKKTLLGIARAHGKPPEKAPALSVDELKTLSIKLMADGSLIALRDNALFQIGFFGAFRRSELVAIQYSHLNFVSQGVEILIPRSKTDPEGMGKLCSIPYSQLPLCPVTTLKLWLERSSIMEGPIFCAVRHNKCDFRKGLSPGTLNRIIKRRAVECEWADALQYSGHSLRRGFATAASLNGASLGSIMRQGRWTHEGTVYGYIEESQGFQANAASSILQLATESSTPCV